MSATETIPRRCPRSVDIVAAALLLVTVALLLSAAPIPARRMARAIAFPYQLDAEEGFMLNQALRLARGEGLYGDIATAPYLVDNYPPVYPALWRLFVREGDPSLVAGRVISAAAALVAALAIAAFVLWQALAPPRKGSGDAPLAFRIAWGVAFAVLAPMLFLISRAWLRWVPYARVDALAVALGLVGFAAFATVARRDRAPVWRTVAVVLFGVAFLTKQTSLFAPAACALYLLLRDRPAALRFIGALAAAFLVPFLALLAVTGGRYWLHLVTYNRNAMHWNELAGWLRMLWALYAPLVVAVVLVGVGLIAARRASRPMSPSPGVPVLLVGIYFALNAASLAMLAKAGAAENYLLEPLAALALFAGVGGVSLLRRHCVSRVATVAAVAALVSLAFHAVRFCAVGPPPGRHPIAQVLYYSAPRPTTSALSAGDRVMRRIRERPGAVLSEDPIYPLLAGRAVVFQNFIMTELASEGRWDAAPFVRMLDGAEFSVIVAHQDLSNASQFFNRYTSAMREAIARRYRLLERIDRTPPLQPILLYVPKEAAR